MKNSTNYYSNSLVKVLLVRILLSTGMLVLITPCFAQNLWTQKAGEMPTGRWELSTCVVDGKIYAIGGSKFLQALRTVEVYDPDTDSWTSKSDMPTARQALSASVVNGKIYAIGGGLLEGTFMNGESLKAVEEYNPATDTWVVKSKMPTARGWHSAIVLDGKIYIIGGCNTPSGPSGGTAILEVNVYDPATDSWTQKGNVPRRIGAGFTSVIDGKIYVYGGYGGLDEVHEYDPVTENWTLKTDMPTKRCGLSTSVLNGKIYAIGGHPGSSPYLGLNTVEAHNPLTDTWEKVPDMLIGRCGVSTCVMDGKIFVFGGYTGTWPGQMCVTVEEYDP